MILTVIRVYPNGSDTAMIRERKTNPTNNFTSHSRLQTHYTLKLVEKDFTHLMDSADFL